MVKVISMQDMRYLNLFQNTTRIPTKYVFSYNNTLFFCVPKNQISQAVGERGSHIKRLCEVLRRKIKVIPIPNDKTIKQFVSSIVEPVEFKELETTNEEVLLTAGSSSKAALIGRNKRRLLEMQKIVLDFFNKDFKII